MTNELFVNAAALVLETGCTPTHAIYMRVGHGLSRAAQRYRVYFEPLHSLLWWTADKQRGPEPDDTLWWNAPDSPATREAAIYSLLLAHCMATDGRL